VTTTRNATQPPAPAPAVVLADPDLGGLYDPPRTPVVIDVPALPCLCLDGTGDVGDSLEWAAAVDTLRAAESALETPSGTGRIAPLELRRGVGPTAGSWRLLVVLPPDALIPRSRTPMDGGVRPGRLPAEWAVQLWHTTDADLTHAAGWARLERFATSIGYRLDGPTHEVLIDGATAPVIGGEVILRRRITVAESD